MLTKPILVISTGTMFQDEDSVEAPPVARRMKALKASGVTTLSFDYEPYLEPPFAEYLSSKGDLTKLARQVAALAMPGTEGEPEVLQSITKDKELLRRLEIMQTAYDSGISIKFLGEICNEMSSKHRFDNITTQRDGVIWHECSHGPETHLLEFKTGARIINNFDCGYTLDELISTVNAEASKHKIPLNHGLASFRRSNSSQNLFAAEDAFSKLPTVVCLQDFTPEQVQQGVLKLRSEGVKGFGCGLLEEEEVVISHLNKGQGVSAFGAEGILMQSAHNAGLEVIPVRNHSRRSLGEKIEQMGAVVLFGKLSDEFRQANPKVQVIGITSDQFSSNPDVISNAFRMARAETRSMPVEREGQSLSHDPRQSEPPQPSTLEERTR